MITFREYITEFTQQEHEELEEVLKAYNNRRVMFTTMNTVDTNKKYSQNDVFDKPKGMWYALGGAWNEFIKHWDHTYEYQNVFYVDIDYTNILRINTEEKLKNFVEQYNLKPERKGYYIDWIKVSQDYKGLEIIPMRYESRLKYFWYYYWDIPSGCIWDTSAIKNSVKIYPK
jgi:hypothetical protein